MCVCMYVCMYIYIYINEHHRTIIAFVSPFGGPGPGVLSLPKSHAERPSPSVNDFAVSSRPWNCEPRRPGAWSEVCGEVRAGAVTPAPSRSAWQGGPAVDSCGELSVKVGDSSLGFYSTRSFLCT